MSGNSDEESIHNNLERIRLHGEEWRRMVAERDAEIATLRAERDEARRKNNVLAVCWQEIADSKHGWQHRAAEAKAREAEARQEVAATEARARTAEAERDTARERIALLREALNRVDALLNHPNGCAYSKLLTGYSKGYCAAPDDDESECDCGISDLRTTLRSPTPALDGETADE